MGLKDIFRYKDSEFLMYLFLLLLTLAYLTVFSTAGSPMGALYHNDSTLFMIMGKFLTDGKIPYIDFFDHKGPSIIFLEAIGQIFFKYRTGIFLVESICLFISLLFLYKLSRLRLSRLTSVCICLFFLIFMKYLLFGGNSNEELSLFCSFISLYIFGCYFFNKKEISSSGFFVIGLCFSFIFWLRPNNAPVICAIVASLFFFYLIDKDFKSLKKLVGYFILGQLPFSLFYIAFFCYHGALYDLFYGSFLYNIQYAESLMTFTHSYNRVNLFLIGILLVGSVFYYFKNKDYKVFIVSALMLVFCLFSANIGLAYGHYFLNYAPAILFGFLLILFSIDKKSIIVTINIVVILFFLRIVYYGTGTMFYMKEHVEKEIADRKMLYEKVLTNVPKSEYDSLYAYDVYVDIFPLMDLLPFYKYFVSQEWQAGFDPNIFRDINEMVVNKSPKWILVQMFFKTEDGDIDLSKLKNQELVNILNEDYEQYVSENYLLLFKYKGKKEFPE